MVNDLSSRQYSANKNIRFKTSMLRSDLCAYSDECIVVKGAIDLSAAAANENVKAEKDIYFENNATFRSCLSKGNSKIDRQCLRSWYSHADI